MWSIGITTYLLLSGETPFNGKNRQQLFRRISCDEPIFPDDKWGNVSDEAIDFVLRLLTKDPAKRMSASEALRHEWIVGSGAKALMNASMATTSEDLSEVTYHSKKSRDPPPQATTNKKSPSANQIQALIRTLLLCTVIFAITYDENGRGIHERLSGTYLIKSN